MRHARVRSLRSLGLSVAAVLAFGACSNSTTAAWTYAPSLAPSASGSAPAASGSGAAGSVAPSGGGSAPSGSAAAASASAGGSASSGGSGGITIKAQNIAFDQSSIDAPAGQAFTITFDNEDAGVPHNLDVKDGSGSSVAKTDIANGPKTETLQLPALQAGAYTFVCDVHPNMSGTLTVK